MNGIVALDVGRGGDEELAGAVRKVQPRDGVDIARDEHALPHVRVIDDVVLVGEEEMHGAVHHAQRDDAQVIRDSEARDLRT